MPRRFQAGSYITTLYGGLTGTGALTMAAIVRTGSDVSGFKSIFMPDNSTSTWRHILAMSSGVLRVWNSGSSSVASGFTAVANSWYLVAVAKPATATLPTFHVYDYANSRWHQITGSAVIPENSIDRGYTIGADMSDTEAWNGDIAIVGAWRRQLSQTELMPLAFGLGRWGRSAPDGLWVLDQVSPAFLVADRSGKGANQSATIGTSVTAGSVPILSEPGAVLPVVVGTPPRLLPSSPRPERVELQSGRVRIRHVTLQESAGAGTTSVLGRPYRGDWGINGELGWQRGSFNRRIGEEGEFTLELPNAPGSDGILHRDRLLITRTGRRRPQSDGSAVYDGGSYRPGDEWLEIYADGADGNGLVYVGTPTKAVVTKQRITISGWDATWMLKKTREFQAGFWHHAPRDVIDFYSSMWQCLYADDMRPVGLQRRSFSSEVTLREDHAELGLGSAIWAPYYDGGTRNVVYPSRAGATALRAEGTFTFPRVAAATPHTLYFMIGLPSDVYAANSEAPGMIWKGARGLECETAVERRVVDEVRIVPGTEYALAIELRHDFALNSWAYFYVDGTLVATLPSRSAMLSHAVYTNVNYVQGTVPVRLRNLVLKARRPLGSSAASDLRLPGAPAPGGLLGDYFDGANDVAQMPPRDGIDSVGYQLMLAPSKEPIASRVEKVDFAVENPPRWRPWNVPTNRFAVRWSGSIWLDLATSDRQVEIEHFYSSNRARVWIGDTHGAPVVDWPTSGALSGSLRDALGSASGWYPIRFEAIYISRGSGGGMRLLDGPFGGARTVVPETRLSPYGVFHGQVRNDSHYDTLKSVADSYGYQLLCLPRSLETGEFPGRISIARRQGRDTAYVLEQEEAWDLSDAIDAEATADLIMADGAGVADPKGTAQLTAEMLNYDEASGHLALMTGFESLAEITHRPLLQQRLQSLLALSASPWEEVAVRARGLREPVDRWPLPATGASGEMLLFDWSPGDGVRLELPALGVVDETPRQIMGIARDFNPDGIKPPVATFRQRPRSFSDTLRQLKRQAVLPQRNYQGQLVVLPASLGASWGDTYSRVAFPADPSRIVSVSFVVDYKDDTSPWEVDVGGVNRFRVTTTGQYVIPLGWLPQVQSGGAQVPGDGSGASSLHVAARLRAVDPAPPASTGAWTCRLHVVARV